VRLVFMPDRKSPHAIIGFASNLRAIDIFSLLADELAACAGKPLQASVRNVGSGHFVAFSWSVEERPAEAGSRCRG
jgi:hypothetical protein